MRTIAPLLAFAALVSAACGDAEAPSTDNAQLRVVHTVVGVPTVDVIVGGEVVIPSLTFGAASPFVAIPAGDRSVGFRRTGAAGMPPAVSISFTANDSVTIFTIDSSTVINPWVLTDTGSVVPPGKSKLRVVHFAASAPPIDIWRTQPDFPQLVTIMFPFRYQEVSPYLQSDAGDWRVLVSSEARSGGIPLLTDTLFLSDPITVPAGESRTVIVLDREGGGLQVSVIRP